MINFVKRLRCLTCEHVIKQGKTLKGCLCDPDAPTWCALDGERVIALSHALYTIWSVEDFENSV